MKPQVPLEQVGVALVGAVQAFAQAPQFSTSLWVLTHCPLQGVCPLPQEVVQIPLEHTCPVAQALPQPPQLAGLVWVLKH